MRQLTQGFALRNTQQTRYLQNCPRARFTARRLLNSLPHGQTDQRGTDRRQNRDAFQRYIGLMRINQHDIPDVAGLVVAISYQRAHAHDTAQVGSSATSFARSVSCARRCATRGQSVMLELASALRRRASSVVMTMSGNTASRLPLCLSLLIAFSPSLTRLLGSDRRRHR